MADSDKTLKAVFFDIDDTLYATSELADEARANSVHAMIEHGLNLPYEDVRRELDEVIDEFSSNYPTHFDKLLQRLPRNSYKAVNPAILVAAGVGAYHDVKVKRLSAYEDVVEGLKRLSKSSLTLGVISAGFAVKQAEKLVRMQLLSYFNSRAIFITEQIGISKPNPKLFLRVCSDLNLSPVHCMYVGDNPLNDIDPPKDIGMVTVLSCRSGKYANTQGRHEPDFRIDNFWDLLDLLRDNFGVKLAD